MKRIIHPPLVAGKELALAPTVFSTLLHAFEKTDFVKYIHQVPMNGSTVFAPTNRAFQRLGPAANAFLFNSPRGLKYLKALLKYHIAANITLYTDAMYDNSAAEAEQVRPHKRHYHVDLPSLLCNQKIAVDIFRFHMFDRMRINAVTPVAVADVIAKNGVVHVLPRVLFPQRHPKQSVDLEREEVSVEELIERLSPFVEVQREDMNEL